MNIYIRICIQKPLAKILELVHIEDIQRFIFLAVNKEIIDKPQNMVSLISEHRGFIKYSKRNSLNEWYNS